MEPVDLLNCDREPIHVPGAVQPFGALLACEPGWTVARVSENLASHLGWEPAAVLGRPLPDLLEASCRRPLEEALEAGFPREVNPLSVQLPDGRRFEAVLHRSPSGPAVAELEPETESRVGFHPRLRESVYRLNDAGDVATLSTTAAREVRRLTGFDRVMVYRFDADWNGKVVAEDRRPDLEPFLGLHYPASDIPAQARRLYTVNWLRFIPDVAYRPARILPEVEPPLDLSFSTLRSVSPIHVEYLTNMGVTASMSISLVHGDVLKGLIACHHYSGPRSISFTVRESCEYLARAFSWHLGTLEARDAAERKVGTGRAQARVLGSVATAPSLTRGLATPDLLEVAGARGAAVVLEGDIHTAGEVPDLDRLRALLRRMGSAEVEFPLVTDRLADVLPGAEGWPEAAGLLAIDISRDLGEFVLWFRPATERTVDWAGDPRAAKTVVQEGQEARLCPRRSFELWREVVRGRSLPWEPHHVEAATELRALLLDATRKRAAELRDLGRRLAEADRAKDVFLATVSHELRSPLNAILGWVQLIEGGTLSPDRVQRAVQVIGRSAREQARLMDDLLDMGGLLAGKVKLQVESVSLSTLVELALESLRPTADLRRLALEAEVAPGTRVKGDPRRLQQVVNNLLTNALKFTPEGGRVRVTVGQTGPVVELVVADTGVGLSEELLPHVFERFRQGDGGPRRPSGLGLGLAIVRDLVGLHGGTVRAESEGVGRGAAFTVTLPAEAPEGGGEAAGRGADLTGLRVLVVEEEGAWREVLLEYLGDCGAEAAAASTEAEALAMAESTRPDVVVLDLETREVDPVALRARLGNVPTVAVAGGAGPAAGFAHRFKMPVDLAALAGVLAGLARPE